MGRAKRKAKRMSPEQMQFLQQLSQRNSIPDQRQELGMQDKMAAFNRLQEAKQSIVEAPKIYYPPDGSEPESLAYINEQEAQLLRDEAGGSGEMTEYDIPSFQRKSSGREVGRDATGTGFFTARDDDKNRPESQGMWEDAKRSFRSATQTKNPETGKWEWNRPNTSGGNMGGAGKEMAEIDRQAGIGRGPTPMQIQQEQRAQAEEKRKQERHEQNKKWGEQRQGYIDEYGDYKGQYKELGSQIGGYRDKFDTMGQDARAVGDKGATAMEGIGEQYKGITGDAIAAEAKKGQAGFAAGAAQAGGLQAGTQAIQSRQAGYEGQLAGMADKVASGEAGQSQAAMLQGQMEEQRMAGQKGSEEKLRREMAQSGASPAEIAAKVAQFQRQSAGQQAQASRSEAMASQLQGQQLGQQQMGAAAGLMGQALGATGQQLGAQAQLQSQGAQQAALRGQAAGMGMAGAQAQQQAQLASLQGQGQAVTQAAGLAGQGIQQQAGMYGQGIGALQAQGGMIGQQAGMTQAQLNDVMAQQTQAYQEEQARQQRAANTAATSSGGVGSKGLFGSIFG